MAFSEPEQDVEVLGPDSGGALSFTAGSGGVIAGQVVTMSGDNEVVAASTDGDEPVGVATQTVDAGAQVQVAGPGSRVRYTAADGDASEGDLVHAGAAGEDGEVTVLDASTDDLHYVGQVYEGASAQGDLLLGIVSVGRIADNTA